MERLEFKSEKIKIVPINKVKPNTWNPKDKQTEEFAKIKKGIELKGQRLPIIVREVVGGYEIIDGEQRYTACQELSYQNIVIYNEGKVSDKEAKELTIWYQQQVPFNEIELAGLVKDMVTNYPDFELPFGQEEIDDMLKLSDFDWDQFNDKEPEFEEGVRTLSIKMTEGQYKVIQQAMDKVKKDTTDCPDGRALELICADYLSGE